MDGLTPQQVGRGTTGEGFSGGSIRVLSPDVVARHLRQPPTSDLLVTDAGYFPTASRHGRTRPEGTESLIVIVCTGGRGRLRLTSDWSVGKGDVVLVPPRVAHAYSADESEPWTILWFHVIGSAVEGLHRASGLSLERPVAPARELFQVAPLAEEVVLHLQRDETQASMVAAAGAAWHLLASLGRQCAGRPSGPDPVEEAQTVLRSRVGQRTSVPELAQSLNLSASHLSALFRRRTGQSVLGYQISLRMSRARELLDLSQDSIGTIARAVGYDDPLYFTRQFGARHGMSPTEYRRREPQRWP